MQTAETRQDSEDKGSQYIGSDLPVETDVATGVWLPFVEDYRTFFTNHGAEGRRILEQIRALPISA